MVLCQPAKMIQLSCRHTGGLPAHGVKFVVSNLLTFDIEGLAESSQDVVKFDHYRYSNRENEEIAANTMAILDVLAEFNQQATFFVLGRIARDMKGLVKKIADAGHEIACHSFEHRRLYLFPAATVQSFINDAKHCLEDVAGKEVCGFRAPEFSITHRNLWMFDLLAHAGFSYDSSVMPTRLHDVCDVAALPDHPFRFSNGLVEIPLSTITVAGQKIPFGGGGYLRLYPLFITRYLYRLRNRCGLPGVFYLHPYEMGVVVQQIFEYGKVRQFRIYVGVRKASKKLKELLACLPFCTVAEYLKHCHVTTTINLDAIKRVASA